ncbi:cysteine-rich CWC family protein [Thauera sp. AutoDN2]|jgi:hypothetical protein|uniref:cysteine-rich CWC family protein n=1 Tax=unclassified Thauera TaxID=2609274 RepID=UPI003F4C8FDF
MTVQGVEMNEPGNACRACGAPFVCGMRSGEAACWCAAYPAALGVPKGGEGAGCYCPRCLGALIEEKRAELGGMYCRPLGPRES